MNDEKILIDFDVEEHEMLMDLIVHQIDTMDLLLGGELSFYQLPDDSSMKKRYMKLNDMLQELRTLWARRFDNPIILQPELHGTTK